MGLVCLDERGVVHPSDRYAIPRADGAADVQELRMLLRHYPHGLPVSIPESFREGGEARFGRVSHGDAVCRRAAGSAVEVGIRGACARRNLADAAFACT